MAVLIQPSYGNPTARRHWRDTLDRPVRFAEAEQWNSLSASQRDKLLSLHPTGEARFWGATRAQDRNLAMVEQGDVVLFTGRNHVRAIGEVGCLFQNAEFADTMWLPHPDNGSWRNVYSLISFEPTLIPYQELRDALGSAPNDNFMGLRVIRDEREEVVRDALGVATVAGDTAEAAGALETLEALSEALGNESLVPPERARVYSSSYVRAEREVLIRRVEATLVKAYEAFLPPTSDVRRIRCSAGLTDLYVMDDAGNADLLEAKSSASHLYVRQALGQILDYAHAVDSPLSSVSTLFPTRPATTDVTLLHRYGVDCVYHEGAGAFQRESAPDHRRDIWRHR